MAEEITIYAGGPKVQHVVNDGGGSAVSVADGADITQGAIADAAVVAGAAGTISAKLRRVTTDLDAVKTSVASLDSKTTAVNTGAVVVSSSALPTLAATSTKQSDGSQKTQIVDGSGNVIGSTGNALDVNIKTPATLPVSLVSVPSHAVTNAGTFAVQATEADGANTTLGAKADAKSTATDTTAISAMSVLKQISASVQAPPSQAVTNAGTFVVQENGSQVQVDDAAFTPATSKIVMVGFEADESSTDSVDEGDGGAARMTLDRKVITTVQPHTAGGLSVLNATSSDGGTALTSTAQVISAAAGQVYGWYIYNPNSSAQFVQFYNTAQASVTVGTTNPLFMLTIPATSAANVNFVQGIAFSNAGFSCSATSTAGGNGAPSTALDAVIYYK